MAAAPPPAAPLSPADVPGVLQCLHGALQQDVTVRRPAEAALGALEARGGFCSCLAEIIAQRPAPAATAAAGSPAGAADAPDAPRWLAAVYFKNCIARYWRPRRGAACLTDEERAHLRGRLLELLDEPSQQVAIQVALIVARIARTDYPREWPALFPTLLVRLQQQAAAQQAAAAAGAGPGGAAAEGLAAARSYLALHHVLKELASKRLAMDQKAFQEVASQLWPHVWEQWCADTSTLLQSGLPAALAAPAAAPAPPALLAACERWRLALKCLRRLLVSGFPPDARTAQDVPAVRAALPPLLQALCGLLHLWPAARDPAHAVHGFLGRACLKLLKTAVSVQDTHPFSFRAPEVLPPWVEFALAQVMAGGAGGEPRAERLLIQCMQLLQAVIRCPAYKPGVTESHNLPPGGDAVLGGARREVSALIEATLPAERLRALTGVLLERYFPLTSADLEHWARDPEGFHHEEDGANVQDVLRPCADGLLLTLLEAHREALAPAVLDAVQLACAACPPEADGGGPGGGGAACSAGSSSAGAALRRKEAAYHAAAVGAFDLHDSVDFAPWFTSTLLPELTDRRPATRPLRRQAALLLGNWVPKLPPELRPAAYQALVALLAEPDAAVQLAATAALRALVDDWAFEEGPFLPYIASCLQLLLDLLRGAAEFDTQLQAFSLVVLIINRVGTDVKPHAAAVLAALPAIWRDAAGQSLLRIQVLVATARLVKALGRDSPTAHPLVIPLIGYACDPKEPEALSLCEDGLELWRAALRYAPAGPASAGLLAAFGGLPPLLAASTEHLPLGVRVLESCVLLGGRDFVAARAPELAAVFAGIFPAVNDKGLLLTLPALELALAVGGASALPAFQGVLLRALEMTLGLGHEAEGVRAEAAMVLMRVLLLGQGPFYALLTEAVSAAPGAGGSAAVQAAVAGAPAGPAALVARVMVAWMERLDDIGGGRERKKRAAVALCMLFACPAPGVLDRLGAVLTWLVGLLRELEYEGDEDAPVPPGGAAATGGGWAPRAGGTWEQADDGDTDDGDEAEAGRRLALRDADPVALYSLRTVVQQQLAAAQAAHGEAAFGAAVAKVHGDVLAHIQALLQTPAAAAGARQQ